MNGQPPKVQSKAYHLVLDILQNVKTSIIEPEDTLKIESSGGNQNSNELLNESGSTVKLPEDDHDKLPEDDKDDFEAEQECILFYSFCFILFTFMIILYITSE